jgi:hypothetical protein
MVWRLEGSYFENCNCDVVCPCFTSDLQRPADQDRCQVVFCFDVGSGEVDGVDVSGLTVAVVVDSPSPMALGNWRVGLMVDAEASEAQAEALTAVFTGQRGGPMAGFAPLIGELIGVQRPQIRYSAEDGRCRAEIGGEVEIEVEQFVAQGTGQPVRLTGLGPPLTATPTIAPATRARGNLFGISFDNEGKHGLTAPFSWAA